MARILAASVLAGAFGVGLAAQAVPPAGYVKAVRGLNAAAQNQDRDAYAGFLTGDMVWIDAAGRVIDRAGATGQLTQLSSDLDVRLYPSGLVAIGTRGDGLVRYLQVWVQRGDQWLLAAHQGSPIGNQPVPVPASPSSPLPANSGPVAEIKAIEQTIDALEGGNTRKDAKNFATQVTDGFVAVQLGGAVSSSQDRATQIAQGISTPAQVNPEAISTRIHGDLAVTNRILENPANGRRRHHLVVHVKHGGRWLRAASITTPVATGKSVDQ